MRLLSRYACTGPVNWREWDLGIDVYAIWAWICMVACMGPVT